MQNFAFPCPAQHFCLVQGGKLSVTAVRVRVSKKFFPLFNFLFLCNLQKKTVPIEVFTKKFEPYACEFESWKFLKKIYEKTPWKKLQIVWKIFKIFPSLNTSLHSLVHSFSDIIHFLCAKWDNLGLFCRHPAPEKKTLNFSPQPLGGAPKKKSEKIHFRRTKNQKNI